MIFIFIMAETNGAVNAPIVPMATLEIESSQEIDGIEAGSTPSFTCKLSEPGRIWWITKGQNLTSVNESEYRERLDLTKASRDHMGNYTCKARTNGGEYLEKMITIRVIGRH